MFAKSLSCSDLFRFSRKVAPKKKTTKTPPPEVKTGTVTSAEPASVPQDFAWVDWAQDMVNHGRAPEALETMNRVRDAYGGYVSTLFSVRQEVIAKPSSMCCDSLYFK